MTRPGSFQPTGNPDSEPLSHDHLPATARPLSTVLVSVNALPIITAIPNRKSSHPPRPARPRVPGAAVFRSAARRGARTRGERSRNESSSEDLARPRVRGSTGVMQMFEIVRRVAGNYLLRSTTTLRSPQG